jgi:hypothetical protein
VGAAWVFTRSGATWTQQGTKLTAGDEVGTAAFGLSVALSSDGATGLIGGPADSNSTGAAWVFTRSGATWTQQGTKLTGTGEVGTGAFGFGVALSADGDTALIGGPVDSSFVGAAWAFTRSAGTWTQQGPKLTGSGSSGAAGFGTDVALSADGDSALIGGPFDNSSAGAAWAFVRSGGGWAQQGAKLLGNCTASCGGPNGSGEVGAGTLGVGVSLSADATTALIGGPGDTSGVGAAWVFTAPAPDAPTAVSAAAGDAQATVTFTPPAGPVDFFTVTASPGSASMSGTSSPIVVSGLANGTTYTFTVTATNAGGTGPASAPSNPVTPAGPLTVPGPPTGVTAAAGDARATVSFAPPASSGGAAITSYTVTASPGGATASGPQSPIDVTGLTNGTPYTFTVTATNTFGPGPSSAASPAVTPMTVPEAPTDVTALPGDTRATVSFTPPASNGGAAITSYTVTASPGGATASGPQGPIDVTGLANGTAYTFTVTATNAAGTGPASTPSPAVTPATVPGAPTGVQVVAGNGEVTVSFVPPTSNGGAPIESYTVTASPGGHSVTDESSPVFVFGLANGTAYTFTVTATNAAGTGPPSSPSAEVAPESGGRAAPAPPADLGPRTPPPVPPTSGPRPPVPPR